MFYFQIVLILLFLKSWLYWIWMEVWNTFPASRQYMLTGGIKCDHKDKLGNIRFHRKFTGFIFRDGLKIIVFLSWAPSVLNHVWKNRCIGQILFINILSWTNILLFSLWRLHFYQSCTNTLASVHYQEAWEVINCLGIFKSCSRSTHWHIHWGSSCSKWNNRLCMIIRNKTKNA